MEIKQTVQGVILDVHVKPSSKSFQLELDEDLLIVSCCEVPVKGKVNKELLTQFARLFGQS